MALAAAASRVQAGPARDLLAENRLEEATTICRQFEVLSSTEADNFLACAWVHYRANRAESGDRMLEKVPRERGGLERQVLEAYSLVKRKKFPEAKAAIDALSGEGRGTPLAGTLQEITAELYEEQGKPDTAAFLYKQIITEDPKNARAHWGLGRYYLGKSDAAKARQHLEQVAKLWPRHLGSRFNLAVIAIAAEQYSEAARFLTECYKLDKSDVGVLEQMGVLFEKKGMLDEAVKYWQRAISLNKDAAVAREKLNIYVLQVVDGLIAQNQFDKALAKLNAMKKAMGKDPTWLLRRGVCYRNLGRFEKAATDLSTYVKATPGDPLAHRELGIAYLNRTTVNPNVDKGDTSTAVNTKFLNLAALNLAKAVELEPQNGMNYAWLAFVLEGKNLYPAARESWKKAMELLSDPKEIDKASRRLAAVEKRLKDDAREAKEKRRDRGEDEEEREEEKDPTDSGDLFQQLPRPR